MTLVILVLYICINKTVKIMKSPKFRNKDNSLTAYSFACGYVERKETAKQWKELYMEHSHYHVRMGNIGDKWQVWETFDRNELIKARRFYATLQLTK